MADTSQSASRTRLCLALQKVLKGSRWILVRNGTELSSHQEEQLRKILKLCPELRNIYLLKEEFRTIFQKVKCREKAKRFLNAWVQRAERTGDKYLLKFLTTFNNWRDQILNYFIERITNGFVEGINNALRATIRIAFGYRNFDNFKLRVLAEFGDFHTNPR